jgi:apolipoprotein N-acyltransferase
MLASLLFTQRIKNLVGWRRNAAAFFCGVLMTLALPPVFALPLLIPAFTILYWLIDAAPTPKHAAADGWWWGMGWHMSGLYWFSIALMTDPEKFAWLIPFALIGLNAIIALYAGIACWFWKKTQTRGLTGIFVFSVIWVVVEYARGHLFSGFPWNLAGYTFTASDAMLQMASLAGAYGLTWFAVLLGAIPAALGDTKIDKHRARRIVFGVYAVLAVGAAWGEWRLQTAPDLPTTGIHLRLVQANIEQNLRWDPAYLRQALDEHIRLTRSPGIENIDVVIWPETAVPFAIKSGDALSHLLGQTIAAKAKLVVGGLRIEGDRTNWRMFNSMQIIDHDGAIVAGYDKVKLVPFGEFIPFRRWLPTTWLTPAGEKDFSTGRPGVTLAIPDASHAALPLICYEVIFPEMTRSDPAFPSPTWLLNITNDAWFGASSGPYQHFHMARMRAVEQGLPLVRVANTGISGVTDGYGRILSKINLNQKGIIDTLLPAANTGHTPYSALGNALLIILIFAASMLIISQRRIQNN